jgi:sugar (pentulose or hexulose) kinase
MRTVIAVDVGTQSLRAGVLTTKGTILFSARAATAPYSSPGNRAEQEPASWEKALAENHEKGGEYLS